MPDTQLTMLTLENPSTQALRKLLPEFEHRSGIRVKLIGVPYDDKRSIVHWTSFPSPRRDCPPG